MKPEVAKIWVDALRSGEYTQAAGVLKLARSYPAVGYHHCCLGVLCELYDQNHEEKLEQQTSDIYSEETTVYFNGEHEILPVIVADWAGLGSRKGTPTNHMFPSLVDLNDNGSSFEKIADVIEKNVENL